jgi:cell division control protein 6
LSQDKLEALFDRFMNGSSIFNDREVLRHDFIPENLPHRENEILKLGAILAPALRGAKCSNVFIYGKTGTGKTAVTKYVLNRLSKTSDRISKCLRICYINCRVAGTEYRVLSKMCASVNISIPFTGLATAEVFSRLRCGIDASNQLFIAVLDEVDKLVKDYGDEVLYELTRANEELKRGRVSILGISNDLYFKELLDPRVLSSLSEEEIVFKPYAADQIRDILSQRVKVAFHKEAISEAVINLCAALAAAEHGDARRALDLIRVAGEVAERKGAKRVLEEHVREAQKKIEYDRVYDVLSSLPLHSKILLCALYDYEKISNQGVTTGDLYEIYHKLCNMIGAEALTHRRVSGLLAELDMLGIVNANIANLGRYGRTKKIRLTVPQKILQNTYSEDPRMVELLGYCPKIVK